MDARTAIEHNLWQTPEGLYLRLVVIRDRSEACRERMSIEGMDIVLYVCEEIPLRDTAAVYNFFKNIGISNIELIYGETSRVKIFRIIDKYDKVLEKLLTIATPSEGPTWAKS
ncbi:hypothetical protein [Thermoproteus tenax]|uniref:Uncharacterized protein n=1 Tax=Thermoproteus tenax (strain ATCC 35583 / DSM 2078 / JCM 9277 / NBRC 100435 / Kra 1) TaxID=768679 RepID=G4RL25_THETK|nr:hypothetical protein [Thermoproteus tenax]CCC82270.1 hypothetical protein TTX_1649 [Thermoproteus tenax Kra 1]